LQADAVQEVGRHDQEAVRCGRARHARSPQQRLRRVDEPAASTGPARRTSGYRSANLTGCRGVAQACNRGGGLVLTHQASGPTRSARGGRFLASGCPLCPTSLRVSDLHGLHAQGRAGVGTNGGAAAAAAATDACGGAARAVKPGAALKPRGSRGPQRRLPLQD
jgi:hypothetical protein